ncbi:matrix-remodeling-associated protein 5 [Salmo trutta]|uniref:matrix-remodeling-associated protein 5 n=1 Tax=Salmo trutta TaxID=8032 RepID=UPI00113124D6|nr:matrix-remodeling-associated protein 5-like [Salmo trutta]
MQLEDKHVGRERERVNQKNNPVWTNRRRPPYRRGRPPQRRVRPQKPSLPSSHKPQTTLPQPATRVEKQQSTASQNDNSKMEDNITEHIPTISTHDDIEPVDPIIKPSTATDKSDSIHIKSLTPEVKDPSIVNPSNREHVSAPETITSAENLPPPTEVPQQERTWENLNKQDVIRQTTQNRQTSPKITTTTKPTHINYDINLKPNLSHDMVAMATPVLTKLDVSDKGAAKPETPLTKVHFLNPIPKKSQDKTQTHLRTVAKGSAAREDILRNTHRNSYKKEEDHSQMKPDSPSLPIHPWIYQKNVQMRVQTTPPPRAPTPYWPYSRFPVWPSVHGSGPHPAFTERPMLFPHPGGRGVGVTNRPEITAETVRPTAFISASPGSGMAAPLTSHPPHRGPGPASRTRQQDLLMLSKLRNRYRQAQLDRISQLGKRVTTKPKISHPTPRPHYQPPTPSYNYWHVPPTTSLPVPTNRPYSTASVLYGSRWHYSHWGPRRLSTALPFPKLMGSGVKPRITSVNTVSVSALAEGDVLLPCEASGDPQPTLSWTKVSTGATVQANTKHGQRFEVVKNGTFVIKNVQLQDRGQYLCTAQNTFGSDRMVITLAVLTQPPKIIGPHSREVPVYLGKAISLDCVASGKPQAQISWILPDRTFVRDVGALDRSASLLANGTLRIQSANFSSKGDYRCIASNAAGADTVTFHIHVAALPPTINEEASESIVIQEGRSVYVHCTAKGEPAPVLKWSLPAGVHVKPSQFLGRRLFVFPNGTLYIKNISPEDSGRYECSVTNAVGAARRVLYLKARQEVPSLRLSHHPSQQHRVTAMYGSTVYLHCPESTGSPRGTLWQLPSKTLLEHRYSPERPVTVFSNGTLRILQLTEKDGGSYLCMFQRPNGEDMELFQVQVLMMPPKIEHLATAQKRVTSGENFQVDCVASGLPDPEVSWSLPDGTMINNALQSDDSGTRSRRYVIFGNGTLLLQQMGKKDEGDYTCHAKNELGEDEMKVSVKVGPDFPRITSKAQLLLTARLGESAYMTCQAIGEPPPTIVWLSPSNDVITSSSTKYQILDDGTLVIKKVTLADQGKYACVARSSAGDDIKNIKIQVEPREPHINEQGGRSSMKLLAVSYQTTLLDCRAEGKPEPRVSWAAPYGLSLPTPYLGGRFQVHKNGSLELRGVRKTDEGQYVCLAKNHLGEASLAIDLEVASIAEKPSFAMPNIEILPIKQDGSDVTLECPARGKPNPEFVWILPNGTALMPGTRHQHFTHYRGNGTLRIAQTVTADKGVYRCLAKNVAGTAEKRYALEPGRKPVIRGTTGVMKITFGQILNLPCSVDGWPQASITWTLPNSLVLDKPQVVGRITFLSNGTLQLKEVATFDRGTYVCKATNTFGSSALSYPVAVMVYPPSITNAPPSITRVHRGSSVTLNCIAAGIPKPEITWTLPGRTTLVPNNRFTAQGGIHMTVEGSLVIQDPMLMNSGIYKCNAKNALGSDFKATYLQVI